MRTYMRTKETKRWKGGLIATTHRLHSSSFLGLPYRVRNTNHKRELLWSLWVLEYSRERLELAGPRSILQG